MNDENILYTSEIYIISVKGVRIDRFRNKVGSTSTSRNTRTREEVTYRSR